MKNEKNIDNSEEKNLRKWEMNREIFESENLGKTGGGGGEN